MSLQKPPHQSYSIDKPLLTRRQVLRDRRRTLQTVSELSPPIQAPPDNVNPNGQTSDGYAASKKSRASWRGSLPQQAAGFEQGFQTQPSILITSTDPPALPHSQTTSFDWKQAETSDNTNANRPFVNFSLRRPSSHLQERRQSGPCDRHYSKTEHLDPRQSRQTVPKGKQPVRVQDDMGIPWPYGDGWNARRERDRIKREQAVLEAKARREREGRGIVMGSSSTLPSLSPLPMAKLNQIYTKGGASQQQLLQNSRTMNGSRAPGQFDRRTSRSQMDTHRGSHNMNAQLLMHASTNSNTYLAAQGSVLRPRSMPSNFPGTSQAITQHNQMPSHRGFSTTRSFSSPIPPAKGSGASVQNRLSPSVQASQRSSSVHSITTANTSISNGARHSHISRKTSSGSYTSYPEISQRHRTGVTEERLDALAALTASTPLPDGRMTPKSLAFLETRQNKLDENIRSSPDLTLESILLLREREKLLGWKAEREKLEFERKQRLKIKERVRRANELEEERSKAMEKETKRKMGCCGFWGI